MENVLQLRRNVALLFVLLGIGIGFGVAKIAAALLTSRNNHQQEFAGGKSPCKAERPMVQKRKVL